jgi:lysine 6-dehydrogenase
MSKIIVLGGGMVGSAMAIDLSSKHQVTLADQNNGVLQKVQQRCRALTTMQLDVTNRSNLLDALKNHDLVICAVPGFLGYNTLKVDNRGRKRCGGYLILCRRCLVAR